MKRILIALFCLFASLQLAAQTTLASYAGAYSSGTTYIKSAIVTENGVSYVSLIAGNIGHDPASDTSHTYWAPLATASRSSIITPLIVQSSQDAANTPTSTWYTTTIPATSGNQNLVAGVGAGANLYAGSATPNYGGQSDVVLGYNACAACTTAREGVYIGANAAAKLQGGTGGTGNTPEDDINIAIGSDAMAGVASAGQNVVIGQKAAVTATSMDANVIEGIHAATNASSLSHNVFVGNYVLDGWAGTAERNTVVGANSLQPVAGASSDMQDNTLIGAQIGGSAWTTAARNVIAGSTAVPALSSGSDNVIAGFQGARSLTTGSGNILLGSQTAPSLTTGSGNVLFAANGIAGNGITTGLTNFCVFAEACNGVVTGSDNIMLGVSAGQNGGDTSGDVLLGRSAGFQATDGTLGSLTAVGYKAAQWVSTGASNVALGANSLGNTTTESGNVGIGFNANTAAGVSNSAELGAGSCPASSTLCFQGVPVAGSNGVVVGSVASSVIASATTIAPVNLIQHVSGTVAIATITPPSPMSATVGGCLTLIADGAWTTTTAGNIANAITASAGTPYQACYDGAKWYIK